MVSKLLNLRKIGIIGKNFGKKVFDELSTHFSVSWYIGSESDYRKQSKVDLVYIATPIEQHFEQAVFFLSSKTSVVVEKSPCMSAECIEYLIKLSKLNGVWVYFSDIYRFRRDIINKLENARHIRWHKLSISDDWIVTRLGYHYFYLFNYIYPDCDWKIKSVTKNSINLCVTIKQKTVELLFSEGEHVDCHMINQNKVATNVKGPISAMMSLDNFTYASIKKNHLATISTVKLIEKIRNLMPSVLIVGGGIFGCQTGIQLAKKGYNIQIQEEKDDLCECSSAINQYRIHAGYHYPRSNETARDCLNSSALFKKSFRTAMIENVNSFYSIAEEGSLTSSAQYLKFLKALNLPHDKQSPLRQCELTVSVEEDLFDPIVLKESLKSRIYSMGVQVLLNTTNNYASASDFDYIVYAVYKNTGSVLKEKFQFEVCEKPVVKLDEKFCNISHVIMDGPFMCIDPLGNTGYHVMGNVRHAIHSTNIGEKPVIPKELSDYIDAGIIKDPPHTKFEAFKKMFKEFFGNKNEIRHIGSMYTVRTVLPYREKDDARPTQVHRLSKNEWIIFSGKIVTSVELSKLISNEIALEHSRNIKIQCVDD